MPEGSVVVGHTPRSVAEILEQDAGERRGYPVKKVEIDVHRFIAHLTHKMRFKIVLPSRRSQRLGLSASHGTDIVRQRRAKLPQWLDDPLPLFDWAVVAEENSAYFVPTIWEGRQEGDDIHLVVTVQTCGDLRAIRPLTEGQPSTEFALQADSSPQT